MNEGVKSNNKSCECRQGLLRVAASSNPAPEVIIEGMQAAKAARGSIF